MGVCCGCCGSCHIVLDDQDKVILDSFGVWRHEKCYDHEKYLHLIDTVGVYESVKGKLPTFLINVYREILAMDEGETRTVKEIPDEEVVAVLAGMFVDEKYG